MKDNEEVKDMDEQSTDADSAVAKDRREAIAKLAYSSPIVAGILFSKGASAFTPPGAPG